MFWPPLFAVFSSFLWFLKDFAGFHFLPLPFPPCYRPGYLTEGFRLISARKGLSLKPLKPRRGYYWGPTKNQEGLGLVRVILGLSWGHVGDCKNSVFEKSDTAKIVFWKSQTLRKYLIRTNKLFTLRQATYQTNCLMRTNNSFTLR